MRLPLLSILKVQKIKITRYEQGAYAACSTIQPSSEMLTTDNLKTNDVKVLMSAQTFLSKCVFIVYVILPLALCRISVIISFIKPYVKFGEMKTIATTTPKICFQTGISFQCHVLMIC